MKSGPKSMLDSVDQMSTVHSKPAGESATKWKMVSKVVVITRTNWGRLSPDDRKNFLQSSFRNF